MIIDISISEYQCMYQYEWYVPIAISIAGMSEVGAAEEKTKISD